MNILEMKQKDFRNMEIVRHGFPKRFKSLVIIPEKHMHDSGWACMSFVAVDGIEPVCRFGGGSDVVHIDGFMGCGPWKGRRGIPEKVVPKAWSFDMLPCGFVRLMPPNGYELFVDDDFVVSSFEIFSEPVSCMM